MKKGRNRGAPGYDTAKIIARMFSYVKKYKLLVIMYMLLSIGGALISLLFANMINISIEAAVNSRQSELLKYMLQSVAIIAAGIIVTYFSTYIYGIFKSKVMLDIRNSAVSRLRMLRLSFIENSHTGDLISRYTNDMSSVQNFIGEELFKTLMQLITLIITSVYLINVNYKLYIFSLILMPPVLYLSTRVTKPMGKLFNASSTCIGKANSVAQDSYGGIFIIKAFSLENHFYKRFSEYVENGLQYSIKAIHRLKWLPPFNIILWSSPFTICLIYGAYLSINSEISPGQLPAFVYLLNNIVWPFAALPRIISGFRSSFGTAQRFFEVLDSPAEREDGKAFDISPSKECINFKHIVFSYERSSIDSQSNEENARRAVLNDLCFSLKKGTKTALVGRSGCGKSTVLKLIAGFYDYQEGAIELFGHDMQEWSLKALRANISFVTQDTYLLPASVYENILFGKPDSAYGEVVEAARAANAHEFIMELPDGYDTMVGERGIKLSGGQKQRLSLARAFLKDAPLILLDEPTSALDNIAEAAVQQAMNAVMQDKTAIIVGHRLSAIKNADEILVLDDGRIVERGTHDFLISAGSLYSRLYNKQFDKDEGNNLSA